MNTVVSLATPISTATEKRAIVLDNVSFVGKKEKELTRELGSIKVQIAPPSDENGSADQAVNSDFAGNSWFAVGKKPILTLTRSVA